MSNKGEENNFINEIFDLIICYLIKESELHLKFLNNQVSIYHAEMRYLDNTRPFFFQKKKLQEYNLKFEECENKLFETYKKINDEAIFIFEMKKQLIIS